MKHRQRLDPSDDICDQKSNAKQTRYGKDSVRRVLLPDA